MVKEKQAKKDPVEVKSAETEHIDVEKMKNEKTKKMNVDGKRRNAVRTEQEINLNRDESQLSETDASADSDCICDIASNFNVSHSGNREGQF